MENVTNIVLAWAAGASSSGLMREEIPPVFGYINFSVPRSSRSRTIWSKELKKRLSFRLVAIVQFNTKHSKTHDLRHLDLIYVGL